MVLKSGLRRGIGETSDNGKLYNFFLKVYSKIGFFITLDQQSHEVLATGKTLKLIYVIQQPPKILLIISRLIIIGG
jgi:hypothetical protein